jgi:hypothetical protein
MPWRRAIAIPAVIATCYLVSTTSGLPTTLTIETSDPSEESVSMAATDTVAAGPVEIELRNRGDTLHDAQLFRVSGDRPPADVMRMLEAGDSQPKPRWLDLAGGVAAVAPGETVRATLILEAGTYYIADTQERAVPSGGHVTNAVKGGISRIDVRGDSTGDLPDTPSTIVARDYTYRTEGIAAGRNRVTFRNAGRQFHQAVAFPIRDGVSFRSGKRVILERRQETGWAPVDVPHERATAVLSGGREQIAELTLDPGRYLLLCFVSDRFGGAPQWTLGMASRLDVVPAAGKRRP